jgi:hypothetical protein
VLVSAATVLVSAEIVLISAEIVLAEAEFIFSPVLQEKLTTNKGLLCVCVCVCVCVCTATRVAEDWRKTILLNSPFTG